MIINIVGESDDMLEKIEDLETKIKYKPKVDKILANVLDDNEDLINAKSVHFYNENVLLGENMTYVADGKAFCIKQTDEIFLSNSVCKLCEAELYRVLLHELIHLTYKELDENDVIKETNKRKPIPISLLFKRKN